MQEFKEFEFDAESPALSEKEGATEPLGNLEAEFGSSHSPEREQMPGTENIPQPERDQVASIIEAVKLENTEENRADPKNEVEQPTSKSERGQERVRALQQPTLADNIEQRLGETLDAEKEAAEMAPPGKEKEARIAVKDKAIAEEKKEIRSKAAGEAIPIKETDDPAKKAEKEKQRESLEKDLENVDLTAFYREYAAILKGDDRERKTVELMQKLKDALNKNHGGEEVYDDAKVAEIFRALTTSEQMQRFSFILFQEQLKIALELDARLGTNVTKEVDDIIGSELTPEEKLRRIDGIFKKVSQIKTQDKELQAKLDQLRGLNQLQGEVDEAAELRIIEEQMALHASEAYLLSEVYSMNENFVGMPEEGIKLVSDNVKAGRGELMQRFLAGKVERMPDGSYRSEWEDEYIYIAEREGEPIAYLKLDAKELNIPETEPESVGYGLTRSKKITLELGLDDIANNPEMRYSTEKASGSQGFMTAEKAKDIRGFFLVTCERNNVNAAEVLRSLGIVDERGNVDPRRMEAYWRTLKLWANGEDIGKLYGTVDSRHLRKLAELWAKEDEEEDAGDDFTIYPLGEIEGML